MMKIIKEYILGILMVMNFGINIMKMEKNAEYQKKNMMKLNFEKKKKNI